MTMTLHTIAALLLLAADGPADNFPDKVKRIPEPGIAVSDDVRGELQIGVADLGKTIEVLRSSLRGKPALLELLPDVQVYHKAVDWALRYNEFYDVKEFAAARKLLQEGTERAHQLQDGKAPWTTATGLVVRGYVSKIDGSVQPYGLVVPASFQANTPHKFRLDLWWHGRGEKLTELSFITGRERSVGDFAPPNAFVLHPYGRYCNANKFAGEVDTFEAMEHVRKNYPIDENRIVARGFSMGGAACWQFAAHYPGVWCAAAPGAGFSETADFLKVFQNETVQPTDYEKTLWHWYDATDYAANFFNLPVVAYSGEIDRQKQAADMMAKAMEKEGITLTHIIGPKTAHAYEPRAKREVSERIDAIAAVGKDPLPGHVAFTTFTLRYNKSFWVTVEGLGRHWERARIYAHIEKNQQANTTNPGGFGGPAPMTSPVIPPHISVYAENVTAFTLAVPPGLCPLELNRRVTVRINGQTIEGPPVMSDRSWTAHFRHDGKTWHLVDSLDGGTLAKRPGLQGPIDDAFMDRFLMVRPTGQSSNEKVGAWVKGEMAHALDHWRRQFRGDAPVKDDTAVTDEDIASSNLVLWGDPSSNKVLARIADKLPVRWDANGVTAAGTSYEAAHHVPVLIYPNPLNPKKYVVLNSGFTFREYDYLNNARQVPKLPDYAVLDVNTPPDSRYPGRVVTAGFFSERWELPTGR
jgi:pimeloyl-ACP methyl ester carboxylesterase